MKNISIPKISLLLVAIFIIQTVFAQDAIPATPAYEPAKTTKKNRHAKTAVAPAPSVTDDGAAVGPSKNDRDNDGTPDKDDDCPDLIGLKENFGCPEGFFDTEAEKAAKLEKAKKDYGYQFKSKIDLFTLYAYLNKYADEPKKELRKEGESVLYATGQIITGAVETYVEVKNDKAEYKSILYRGNNKAEAEKKYAEVAEIIVRTKEESYYSEEGRYCYSCSGIELGSVTGGVKTPIYYVQLITKSTGYEVQLIFKLKLPANYFPSATVATTVKTTPKDTTGESKLKDYAQQLNTNFNEIKAKDDLVKQQANIDAVKLDFCSMLQQAVKEFEIGFEQLKGPEQHSYWHLGKFYYSKKMIAGTTEALVREDKFSGNYWLNILFDGESTPSKITQKYQDYVDKVNTCVLPCCDFTTKKVTTQNNLEWGQSTVWLANNLKSGYNAQYKNMVVEVKFALNITLHTYSVSVWVRSRQNGDDK